MLHAINGLINEVDDQRHEPFFKSYFLKNLAVQI